MNVVNILWPLIVVLLLSNCEGRTPLKPVIPKITPFGHGDDRSVTDDYKRVRESFMQIEESKTLGADVVLSRNELQVNQIIMEAKTAEYDLGLAQPHLFAPSQHLFEVLEQIRKSELFKIISKMPKGGVLHAHDTALCSTDFVMELTYRDQLWVCYIDEKYKFDYQHLKFAKSTPKAADGCKWALLSNLRKTKGAEKVDEQFRKRLTLYPKTKFIDNNEVWSDFMGIFILLDGLLTYAPVWGDYYYNALKEFYADGVQYLEFRTTLPILYDMDGTTYTALDTVRIYTTALAKFKDANPGFIGSKMIYAPLRFADDDQFKEYKRTLYEIKDVYPDFVAGFDLVGQEERGRPLIDFVPQLLDMRGDVQFFFHAGETNWLGSSIDENLIDAVLLGSKRIGHGFAITKHPYVMEMIKHYDIAIEVNPISNQVLQLVSDLRNHPAALLFADNYSIVVSSDDPSFWKSTPLSHDFYVAFLGIASSHTDLRLLKKLAQNSLTYSGMTQEEKRKAFYKWEQAWNAFIVEILKGGGSAGAKRLQTNKIN